MSTLDEHTAAIVTAWPNSDFLRQVVADAYSHRETLTNGYWCSDCDKRAPERCRDCQEDADAMATYEEVLKVLDGRSESAGGAS